MADLLIINPSSGDSTATLFSGPDASEPSLGTVEKGTILKIVGTSGNFYEVAYDNPNNQGSKGGTAFTGTVVAYPYAFLYYDEKKTQTLGKINNGTPITIISDENSLIFKVTAVSSDGLLTGFVESKYIYRDNE